MTAPRDIANPRPGFFKLRLVKDGPWLAARIFLPCPIDPEFGHPMDRSRHLLAEVDGAFVEPPTAWVFRIWTGAVEIAEAEFNYLRDDASWCRQYAPAEPRANPRQSVDPRRTAPVF